MVRTRHLRARDYQVMPWKNHRGTTSQIAIFPPEARFPNDSFLWRVSTATIASSGPFSTFPGYDRTLVILDGSGASINHDFKPTPILLDRMKPYVFRGEWETTCELSEHEIRDFGLMTRREQVQSDLQTHSLAGNSIRKFQATWPTLLIYGARGALRIRIDSSSGTENLIVCADELFWIENPKEEALHLEIQVESGPAEFVQIGLKSS